MKPINRILFCSMILLILSGYDLFDYNDKFKFSLHFDSVSFNKDRIINCSLYNYSNDTFLLINNFYVQGIIPVDTINNRISVNCYFSSVTYSPNVLTMYSEETTAIEADCFSNFSSYILPEVIEILPYSKINFTLNLKNYSNIIVNTSWKSDLRIKLALKKNVDKILETYFKNDKENFDKSIIKNSNVEVNCNLLDSLKLNNDNDFDDNLPYKLFRSQFNIGLISEN